MKKEKVEEVVISDIHLGSPHCKPHGIRKLLEILRRKYSFKRLLIVGDLTEDEKPIGKWQWRLIRYLKKIKDKIVYTQGNHDPAGSRISKAIGIHPVEKHEWERNGQKFCAIHGHQFDDLHTTLDGKWTDRMICNLMALCVLFELRGFKIGKWIVDFTIHLALCFSGVTKKIREYAERHGYHTIISGHTHLPRWAVFRTKDGRTINHYNSGDWVHNLSWLTVDKHGKTRLHVAA